MHGAALWRRASWRVCALRNSIFAKAFTPAYSPRREVPKEFVHLELKTAEAGLSEHPIHDLAGLDFAEDSLSRTARTAGKVMLRDLVARPLVVSREPRTIFTSSRCLRK